MTCGRHVKTITPTARSMHPTAAVTRLSGRSAGSPACRRHVGALVCLWTVTRQSLVVVGTIKPQPQVQTTKDARRVLMSTLNVPTSREDVIMDRVLTRSGWLVLLLATSVVTRNNVSITSIRLLYARSTESMASARLHQHS